MIIRILFVDNSYLDIEICSDGIQIGAEYCLSKLSYR